MKILSKLSITTALAVVSGVLFSGCGVQYKPDDDTRIWTKWGDPKITSDMWDGTSIWQMRTNLETGEVQMKCQRVSEHGGYK